MFMISHKTNFRWFFPFFEQVWGLNVFWTWTGHPEFRICLPRFSPMFRLKSGTKLLSHSQFANFAVILSLLHKVFVRSHAHAINWDITYLSPSILLCEYHWSTYPCHNSRHHFKSPNAKQLLNKISVFYLQSFCSKVWRQNRYVVSQMSCLFHIQSGL